MAFQCIAWWGHYLTGGNEFCEVMDKPWPAHLDEIAKQYKWEPEVTKFILSADGAGTESVADFLQIVSDERELSAVVDAITDVKNKVQQKSRVKQAWSGLRQARQQEQVLKRKRANDTDLDLLLPQPELESLADTYWARYHEIWPPHVAPADSLVSRLFKEVSKKALQVPDIWKVRTQKQYLRSQQKKTKIAVGLNLISDEDEEDKISNFCVTKYLELMFTLFIGFAVAGASRRSGAPAPTAETRMTDPCQVIEVPKDVIMKVYLRAAKKVQTIPASTALAWLEARMEGEFESWVEKYRNTNMSLGEVIQQTYERCEAMWEVESPGREPSSSEGVSHGGGQSPKKGGEKRKKAEHDGTETEGMAKKAKSWASQMKSGSKICKAFNQQRCANPKKKCPHGMHACAGVQPNGRVCGMNHAAVACTNKRVPSE